MRQYRDRIIFIIFLPTVVTKEYWHIMQVDYAGTYKKRPKEPGLINSGVILYVMKTPKLSHY